MKITLFICMFYIIGCTPAAFLLYGVHKPRPLTIEQMQIKYTKLGFDKYEVLAFEADKYYTMLARIETVNSVLVFNENNLFLRPLNEFTCSSDKIDFLKNFKNDSISKIDSTFDLSFVASCAPVFKHRDLNYPDTNYKYTLILTFADFAGKLNKNITTKQLELYLSTTSNDTRLILLSLDPIKN